MKSERAVLVVDDEPLVRMDLSSLLEDYGFTVFEAGTASQAIAVLEANAQIQVVFTDITMPGTMDGLALSRHIRDRWPPTIIVVVSGNARPKEDAMATDAMFIAKPVDTSVLDATIRTIVAQLA